MMRCGVAWVKRGCREIPAGGGGVPQVSLFPIKLVEAALDLLGGAVGNEKIVRRTF